MTTTTSIEWTRSDDGSLGTTWNPVTGCTKVSTGCDHCYAETIANRFAGTKAFPNGFDVTLHPERLREPKRWRMPRRVFVNSMSDLFHDDVPDAYVARVFAAMALAPRHTFQILTKRHARMRALLSRPSFGHLVAEQGREHLIGCQEDWLAVSAMLSGPLPNVWLGVSVEDQRWADIRIPALIETPAAVRFLSCEPLLGPLDLAGWVEPLELHKGDSGRFGTRWWHHGLDWIIVGGESGPRARPMDLSWAESISQQGRDAGAAVFVKQLGSVWAREHHSRTHKGSDPDEWPEPLRVREFPACSVPDPAIGGGERS